MADYFADVCPNNFAWARGKDLSNVFHRFLLTFDDKGLHYPTA
jgi:hypothetical protein